MSCKRKIPLGINILDATIDRVKWLFDTFEQITLSFSRSKDSTVLFHLIATI
jgi:predicted phosphoadenosine phosphosulfate sulfurtransferase